MNKKPNSKRFDFIPNRLNKYSIRKFTVGTSSILIGSLMFLGDAQSAQAEETIATTTQQATVESSKTEAPSTETTTEAPTTEAPSTETTTEAPTTEAPSTETTTEAPTEAPTTESKTTETTTEAPTTESKTTKTTTEEPTTESKTTKTTTEEPTTESKTTETTTEEPTTESKSTEGNNTGATTDSKSTETTVAEKAVTPTTESITEVSETLNNASTTEDKQKTLSDYYAENTGVSSEEAIQTVENLNLDYNNLSSDELMAALLQAIATEQNANTVQATAPQTTNALTDAESITLASNETTTTGTAPTTLSLNLSPDQPIFNLNGSTTPQNVNDYVTANASYTVGGGGASTNTVWVTGGGYITQNVNYKVADAVNEGDYFTVNYGDKVKPSGNIVTLKDDKGSTIATGVYDATNNTVKYTFTNYVDLYSNLSGSYSQELGVYRQNVPTELVDTPYTVVVAGETTSSSAKFDYGTAGQPNINSAILNKTDTNANIITYANNTRAAMYNTTITLNPTGYDYTNANQIQVYRTPTANYKLEDNLMPDLSKLTPYTGYTTTIKDGTAVINLNNTNSTYANYAYVIKSTPVTEPGYTGSASLQTEISYKQSSTTNTIVGTRHNLSLGPVTNGSSGATATAPTYSVGDTVWVDTNKDGIQNEAGTGLPGVTVNLLDSTGIRLATTTTDSSGKYIFTGLSNGSYQVEVVKPTGYEFTTAKMGTNDNIDSDISLNNGKYVAPVFINNSNITTIDAGLVSTSPAPVYDLGDYVWLDSNNDGQQTEGEPGVPGVQVLLKDGNNRTIQTTITDNNGNYGFYELPEGTYTVEFIVPGYYSTTTTGTNPASGTDSNGISTTVNLTTDNTTVDLGLVKQPATVTPEYEITIDDVSYEVIVRENTSLPENTISLVQQGADGRERVVYQLNPGVDPSTMTATNNEEFYSKYFTEVSRQVIYSPQDAIIEYNLPNPVSNIVYNPTTNTYDVTYVDGTKENLPGQTPGTITTETERGIGSIDSGAEVPGTWIYFYTVDANGVRNPDPYGSTFIPDGADGQDGVDGTNGTDGVDGKSPTATVTDNGDGTHTITIVNPDETETTTVVKDGAKGDTGAKGEDGKDGKSPTATVTDNGDGTHTITIVNPDGTLTTTIVKNGVDGKDGIDGKSPTATVKDNGDGTHTITIVNPDGTETTTVVKDGAKGDTGAKGEDGKDGKSPTATVKDNGDGTHTITIVNPDGTETTTVVKDGAKGDTGAKGEDGKDGKSPTATVKDNGDGTHTITIVNPDGTSTSTIVKNGEDGKSPTATVKDNGDGTHTITIVNPDGTVTTTIVKDGIDGIDGQDGIDGIDGEDGKSPTATVKDNGDGTHTITIVNPDGTTTTTVVRDGEDGKSPTATVTDNGDGTHTITIVNPDGTTTTTVVRDGEDGQDGIDGKSPTATVTDNGDGTHTITIVNPDGTTTTTVVKNGEDGKSPTATVKDNGDGTHTITIVNPDGTVTTTIVKDGADGKDGENDSNGSGTIINNNNNINNNINVISIIINNDGDTVINYSNGSTTTIHTGETGKSVVNVTIDKDGNIIVKYSDNTTEVIGNVSNLPGEDGKDGKDGKGISSTFIDKNGHLIITYTDGTTNDLGKVTGQDGRSVTNTIINDKGELIVIYSDGTLDNLGIVKGPKGEDGKSAYQIWLEQGNKGSINDFLESLKGKDGKDCACDKVIVNISKNDHGDLVIKYTDGSTQIIKNDCNNPGTTDNNPGTTPGNNPGTTPGNNPGTTPGNNPGTTPGNNPGTTPGNNPGTTDNNPGTTPGIKDVNVDHEGNVIVSTHGNNTIRAGKVNRGEVRVDENGQNIKEIANVYVDNNDNLIVVHNDYTADNLGEIRNTMTTSEELPDTGEADSGAAGAAGAAAVAGLGALMLYRSRRRA